jgi:hypothetical protein
MQENLNFNEALNTLDVFKELCVIKVKVPSLNREIVIKELSAKQQKQLLSSAVETASGYKSYFVKNLYEILHQNCNETKEVIDSLNFTDYTTIVLALRKQTSPEILISHTTKEGIKIEEKINIESLINQLSSIKLSNPQNVSVKKDTMKIDIELKVPTILDDVTFFEHIPVIKRQDSETESLKQLIAETYMYESAKCIENVLVSNKSLGYGKLSVKQKYALVEKLPANAIQQLLAQYASWKSVVNDILKIKLSNGEEKQLDVDTILFLPS